MEPHHKHYELVEACKNGNPRAQFELYQAYSKAMFNICFRMMGQREEAEDVLQNAFIDIFTKIDTFRHESTIGAWIKRIVINHNINALKKRKMLVVDYEENRMDVAEEKYDPQDHLSEIQRINDAILQLPNGYRVVFTLYLMEGYDHKEIGEILQISEGASKSQYSRAKQKVRQIIGEKTQTG